MKRSDYRELAKVWLREKETIAHNGEVGLSELLCHAEPMDYTIAGIDMRDRTCILVSNYREYSIDLDLTNFNSFLKQEGYLTRERMEPSYHDHKIPFTYMVFINYHEWIQEIDESIYAGCLAEYFMKIGAVKLLDILSKPLSNQLLKDL